MEQINMTKYLIDVVKGVEEGFTVFHERMKEITEQDCASGKMRAYARAVVSLKGVIGIVGGLAYVINNMTDPDSSEKIVLENMFDRWEEECATAEKSMLTYRKVFWDEPLGINREEM